MDCIAINAVAIINDKGLKHIAVAKKAGYSRQQLSNMLNGRKVITSSDIIRLATALDVTPNDLFGITTKQS